MHEHDYDYGEFMRFNNLAMYDAEDRGWRGCRYKS